MAAVAFILVTLTISSNTFPLIIKGTLDRHSRDLTLYMHAIGIKSRAGPITFVFNFESSYHRFLSIYVSSKILGLSDLCAIILHPPIFKKKGPGGKGHILRIMGDHDDRLAFFI